MSLEGTSVLVTGGAGFIGSALTERLVGLGADVTVVDDCSSGSPDRVHDAATLHRVDLRSEDLSALVADLRPDVVYHLAALASVPECAADPVEAHGVNVMGTRQLVDALTAPPAGDALDRYVFTSSAAVYPPSDTTHTEDEAGPIDVYGRTKLVGEDYAGLLAKRLDIEAASARIFNPVGPGDQNAHLVPDILDQIAVGDRALALGNLAPARDYVHIDDVVDALLAMGRPETEIDGHRRYNVGTGEAHTVREVVAAIERAFGEELAIQQDDERVRESDRPHLRADVARIRDELGWTPDHTLDDAVRDAMAARGLVER